MFAAVAMLSMLVAQMAAAVPADVVISQVYGGAGCTAAGCSTYQNDFIELFNRGLSPVSLNGWSVQYASGTGTTWQLTSLTNFTLQPGQYYLVAESFSSTGANPLPAPDASGTIAMSATAGKVALVNNATALAGACPSLSGAIVDFVGYGATANCAETANAPAPSTTAAALRGAGGQTDTDNNSADFVIGPPNPRNSGPLVFVMAPIHAIQGSGDTSPLVGQPVTTTTSIVTARRSNGFFIQTPDADVDADSSTSEGLFVFTSSAPPASAAIGNAVQVSGTVVEFVPTSDPGSPSVTELGSPTVSLVSTGNALPAPVALTSAATGTAGETNLNRLEKYEGMRVHVDSLTVVAPTDGTISEANATSTSTGVFYGVVTGVPRPFREPGVEVPDPIPTPTPNPNNIPRFDGNPERLRIDSNAQPGAGAIEVTTGATVTNITGPLDYVARTYTILPDASSPPLASTNSSAVAVPLPSYELTIGSCNMQRFFDDIDDPNVSDVVVTTAALNNRLRKASLAIRNVMRMPDVIGLEEVENLHTLQALANQINNDAATANQPNPGYQAYLVEGNDVGGIDVGFLVKSATVNAVDVIQIGKDTTYINPNTNSSELLNDRPPLVLRATVQQPSGVLLSFTVIVVHQRSLSGITSSDGNRIRAKRRAQAEFLANYIQARQSANPGENLAVSGDYNAFQFNDGLVDVMGTVRGTPAPPEEVLLASSDLVNPDLTNLSGLLSPAQRYSYVFDGNAQSLDHSLVNNNMFRRASRFVYARNNADFPESFRNDPSRPERFSDHDPEVAYFALDGAPPGLVANVSTRLQVGKDDDALFEGFIIQGAPGSTKKIIVRGLGPFLAGFLVPDPLANPTLDIFQGSTRVATNNDWRTTQIGGLITADQSNEIATSGFAPSDEKESAIIANLAPGSYTAVLRGLGNTTGIGLVDAFDLSAASSAKVVNFSTRGLVQPGDKLLTAGFIIQNGAVRAVVRAIGPSLAGPPFNIANALPDTTLQLRDQNGAIVRENDDWQTDQKAELENTGLQPTNAREAALVQTIHPGQYTAQVRGKPEQIGIGVVEIYFIQ
jgi:predicted extracellular nuclease